MKTNIFSKLDIVMINMPYYMFKEYGLYSDFFGKLNKSELNGIIKHNDLSLIKSLVTYLIDNINLSSEQRICYKNIKYKILNIN